MPCDVPCPHCWRRPHDATTHDLRRLCDDAVSDVHPEGGPEQIRARARRPSAASLGADHRGRRRSDRGRHRRRRLAGPAPVREQPAGRRAGHRRSTHGSQAPAEPARTVDATVYYVGDTASGPRLFPEMRHVTDATGERPAGGGRRGADGHRRRTPTTRTRLPGHGVTAKATTRRAAVTIDLSEPNPAPGEHGRRAGRDGRAVARLDGRRARPRATSRCGSRSRCSRPTERARRATTASRSQRAERRLGALAGARSPARPRARRSRRSSRSGPGRHLRGQRGLGAQAG